MRAASASVSMLAPKDAVQSVAQLPQHAVTSLPMRAAGAVQKDAVQSAVQLQKQVAHLPGYAVEALAPAAEPEQADVVHRGHLKALQDLYNEDAYDPDKIERFRFKVVLIGESDAAKRKLFKSYNDPSASSYARLLDNDSNYTTTDGYEEIVRNEVTAEGDDVRLTIWDIGADRRYRMIVPTLLLGAGGFMPVYDCAGARTLRGLEKMCADVLRGRAFSSRPCEDLTRMSVAPMSREEELYAKKPELRDPVGML